MADAQQLRVYLEQYLREDIGLEVEHSRQPVGSALPREQRLPVRVRADGAAA